VSIRSEREHVRYAHEAALTFAIGGRPCSGRTRNVSRGGVCANLTEALPTGAEIALELALVFDHDVRSDSLVLPARVVWCTPVDEAFQVGFAFKPLDAKRAEHLALFLRYLDDHKTERDRRSDDVDDRFR
jgi:hypothetical protein